MINQKNRKTIFAAITITLILAISSIMTTFVVAHDPPWSIRTWAYLTVSPDPVGVDQELILYMCLSLQPPTASGALGDRWHGFEAEVTKPDGTKQTLGPYDSDPIGYAWALYTPTQIGTYTFQFSFPGQTLAGDNPAPPAWPGAPVQGAESIGDYFEPSTSDIVSITVQQDPISSFPNVPLPTEYWTRPINAQYRDWGSFSGNWLTGLDDGLVNWLPNKVVPNTNGPETSHILWTKPIDMGGLVGGEFGTKSYHSGGAYEGKWTPPVIINGILYYNEYTSGTEWSSIDLPGVYAVDLRSGEELWHRDDVHIDFGQIYMYDSPNQHGAFAYVWAVDGSTWNAYNAFTGDWWYAIENVPSGTMVYGPKGEILTYVLDTENNWLAMWNSSKATDPEDSWTWRPYQGTMDGQEGYTWNVTIPADLEGGISHVLDDRIIVSSGLGDQEWSFMPTEEYTVAALSLNPGREGQLLWKKDYVALEGVTLDMGPASLEDGVFAIWSYQTRQWWGYSLENGNPLWGPTGSQAVWDRLVDTDWHIAYGKLFSCGYGGTLYAYDITTGDLEWTHKAEDPYYSEALWGGNYMLSIGFFADEKVYVYSTEHSPDDPKERGSLLRCIDVENGEIIWTIPFYVPSWAENPAIADGIIACLNSYDNLIYAFGKGPSAITVTAPDVAVTLGDSIMIKGTVTDQCAGAKDLVQSGKFSVIPAMSDDSMSEWMEYLYMQKPVPSDVKGVEVTIDVVDSNGNYRNIGMSTTDISGTFGLMWAPDIPGQYSIIATFAGSESYGSSYAQTYLGVVDAPQPTAPPEATPAPMTDTYLTGSTIAILAGIGIAVFLLLRKK